MSAVKYRAVKEDTRALVRVVKVDSIKPIKKADFVELAIIGGWQCVVKKGEFQAGSLALYAEIDALLPVSNPVWAFLGERKEGQKTFDGVLYSRIRTVKLRGEVSQGLLTPLPAEWVGKKDMEGANMTNIMGVRKLEEEILNTDGFDGRLNREGPVSWWERLVRIVAGKPAPSLFRPFPSQISKSEQQRVQNIGHHYAAAAEADELFEETVKADGQSMTVYSFQDMDEAGPVNRYGVCSRNYDMGLEDITFTWEQAFRRFIAQNMLTLSGGSYGFYRTALYLKSQVDLGVVKPLDALKELFGKRYYWFVPFIKTLRAMDDNCVNFALTRGVLSAVAKYNVANNDVITVQGELFGPGIQKNYERPADKRFAVYQVYRNGKLWVAPAEAREIVAAMGLEYIHVLCAATVLPKSLKDVLASAKGKGVYAERDPETNEIPEVRREGIVFKSTTRDFSFKVISNEYLLLKEKEADAEEATEVEPS
jgi:hypothetical protein